MADPVVLASYQNHQDIANGTYVSMPPCIKHRKTLHALENTLEVRLTLLALSPDTTYDAIQHNFVMCSIKINMTL